MNKAKQILIPILAAMILLPGCEMETQGPQPAYG